MKPLRARAVERDIFPLSVVVGRMLCTAASHAASCTAWKERLPERAFAIDHGLWLTMGSGVREVEGAWSEKDPFGG